MSLGIGMNGEVTEGERWSVLRRWSVEGMTMEGEGARGGDSGTAVRRRRRWRRRRWRRLEDGGVAMTAKENRGRGKE